MESMSEPGKVHCSNVSAQLLKEQSSPLDELRLRRRGVVDVKGKGGMTTFFVAGKRKE